MIAIAKVDWGNFKRNRYYKFSIGILGIYIYESKSLGSYYGTSMHKRTFDIYFQKTTFLIPLFYYRLKIFI